MIALFLGSFGLMAWTYRKPWRLGWISCWTPPLAACLSYLIQLLLFSHRMPRIEVVLVAVGVGALVGGLRATTHQVFFDGTGIKARRTFGYVLIWIVAYIATQVFATVGRNMLAHAGLITGAFATAMLAMVSIVIFFKFLNAKSGVVTAEVK